jgi:hypothetical protein
VHQWFEPNGPGLVLTQCVQAGVYASPLRCVMGADMV